jgi:hypothetical protein
VCVFIGLAVLPTLAPTYFQLLKNPTVVIYTLLEAQTIWLLLSLSALLLSLSFSVSLSLCAFLVFLFTDWLAFHMLSHPLYQATSVTIIKILFLDAMAMCSVLGFMCASDVVVVLLLAAALDGFDVVRFTCRFFFFLICGRSFCSLL